MLGRFLKGRLKGIAYSIKGGVQLLRTEASIQAQFVIAIVVTIAGFYFEISRYEWIAQVVCIGLVMGLEGLNTAIEEMADFVHPEQHATIGKLKDIAAGAVGIAALIAMVVAGLIYIPKLL